MHGFNNTSVLGHLFSLNTFLKWDVVKPWFRNCLSTHLLVVISF